MGACLFKPLALAQALLLALPVGWCCPALDDQAAEAPARPSACQKCSEHSRSQESGSRPVPAPSDADCCCEPVAALPASAEKLLPELPIGAFGLDPLVSHAWPTLSTDTTSAPLFAGRPLQILYCVWLC